MVKKNNENMALDGHISRGGGGVSARSCTRSALRGRTLRRG